jgi:hypothetical protein
VIDCIRQRVLTSSFRERLTEKLRAIAERELGNNKSDGEVERLRSKLSEAQRRRDKAAENLALADGPGQFRAVAAVFEGFGLEVSRLEADLAAAQASTARPTTFETEVEAALAMADRLADSGPDPDDMEAAGELFRALNVRLFLGFKEVKPKKRSINVVAGGVVTFGAAPAPVALYAGPTGRRALKSRVGLEPFSSPLGGSKEVEVPDVGGRSLGNVGRVETI